jgi:hypothetical protein
LAALERFLDEGLTGIHAEWKAQERILALCWTDDTAVDAIVAHVSQV